MIGLFRIGVAFFVLCAAVCEASQVSSVNVPLDHWAYEYLDKIGGYGLIHSGLHGTRPYTRMEVGRLLKEALDEKELKKLKLPPLIDHFLDKLKNEFKEELEAWDPRNGKPARTFLKPVEDTSGRYVYINGVPRRFTGYQDSFYRIDASEGTALVHDNEGVKYGEHNNLTLQFSSSMRFFDLFSGYVEPIFMAREDEDGTMGFDNPRIDLLKGYAKFSPWNVEIQYGRDSMWWGQGYHGDLLITDNATPFDMVKVTNPTPKLLPWYFSYLGPVKYTFFYTTLEDFTMNLAPPRMPPELVVSDVSLAGWRLNFKPTPWFEMGVSASVLFGGAGQPDLTFSDVVSMLFFLGGRTEKGSAKFDQLAALDFRFQLPFLRNTEIYASYGGEDTGSYEAAEEILLGDVAYMVGFYIPRLTDDGKTDLRFEYANNAHRVDDTPAYWYGHPTYASGYTHDGLIIGHHMGGDAYDVFARIRRFIRNDLVIGFDYNFMKRGLTLSPVQESVSEFGADITYEACNNLKISARFGYGLVDNFDLVEGDDRDRQLLMTVIKWSF